MIEIGCEIPDRLQVVGEATLFRSWKTIKRESVFIVRMAGGKEKMIRTGRLRKMFDKVYKFEKLSSEALAFKRIFCHYKSAARKRKIFWSLSKTEFYNLIDKNCHYCSAPPSNNEERTKVPYSGIDRIDSNLGYELTNCVPSCWICNRAKKDLSMKEFDLWVGRLVRSSLGRL